jgi:hypothetical protein
MLAAKGVGGLTILVQSKFVVKATPELIGGLSALSDRELEAIALPELSYKT